MGIVIRAILRNSGVSPRRLWAAVRGWRRYVLERARFRTMAGVGGMAWGRELPMLGEADEMSGGVGAYLLQDQLVARWIHEAQPRRHVDVGSRIDGFIASVSVFREIEVLDIRPQRAVIHNVRFHQVDLMAELAAEWEACTDSLSCLHTIEHFGLGRYGDALDPDGHLKGLRQLMRMVEFGGLLYLSTPVGYERVEFNAHRVFDPRTVLSWFEDAWVVERSAVIDDDLAVAESGGGEAMMNAICRTGVGIVCVRKGAAVTPGCG